MPRSRIPQLIGNGTYVRTSAARGYLMLPFFVRIYIYVYLKKKREIEIDPRIEMDAESNSSRRQVWYELNYIYIYMYICNNNTPRFLACFLGHTFDIVGSFTLIC